MRTLLVDRFNDLTVGEDGNLALSSGVEAIGQTTVQFVRARRNEMIHNMDQGLPMDLLVWTGNPNEAQYEAAIRASILMVEGVLEIRDFAIQRDGDVLSYTATIQTVEGETAINGQ